MSRDGCARGQASAVGAVFITMVFILLAVLVSRQIQVQTEVQRIASEVLEARRSEGALSLKVNDTYTSNSAGVAVAEEGQGTCDPAALLKEDGYYCTFNAVNIGGTYVLKLNLSAQSVPPTLLNTTCRMLLYSNATLQASLYEKVNASLALLQTFTLPNATWTRLSVGSKTPSYVLLAQSQSPFQLKLDYLGYTYTVYNSTGFYAIVANGGPGHAYIYAVWAVTSEAPTGRIAVNRLLEPGDSVTVSVPIPSYNVSELRVATSTRVYIYKIRASLPPTRGAPPGALAKFAIVSYNTTVTGATGSLKRFVASVKNVGNASGTVSVEVYDHAGSLVGKTSLSLSPGQVGEASITITLPGQPGTYTWMVLARNAATGGVDDSKSFTVNAVSWLYSGWLYRKGHDIVGSTAGAVSGYQVRLRVCSGSGTDSGDTVYLNGKGRADFGDLRFSYLQPDGREVAIPYWVESVSGGCATVWVKVPSIPASPGTARIYVYYGNPSATSESNGAATFIYFNDFSSAIGFTSFPYDKGADGWGDVDGSDSSGWQLFQGALKHRVTVDASHMYALTDVQNGNVAVCVLINLGKLEEIEEAGVAARHSVDANGYIRQYYARLIYAPSLIDSLTFRPRVNVELVKSTGLPSEVEPVHVYYSLQANTWYKLEMRLYGGHITVYVNDSKVIDWTDSSPITSGSRLGLFSAYNKNVDHLYDNFYVRNYVEPEPSHGQWLPEETPPADP
ncbi:DUF2341 domain-containing protein [Thermofilum pendens]|uniref:DUF2341 domain-containing protein n=1 Tax=Thermofilum pendens (strain DSM 2475 / Hrk 5) TaxID=368408 RepID=A1RYR7_THEPD|nr:DUF2341 domain-containing protein [Thermofilum pendens]ABL78347.1 hypothetical protein Tpen_0947 [Thermofilum pendens Hrk 5]